MTSMSLDTDLITERNARLLRDVRAERFRRRSRKDRGLSSGAHRIAKLFQQHWVIGQKTTAEKV